MIVVLMGYMGSGKSTIGKELATVLNYSFLDLDDYIVNREIASISDIFQITRPGSASDQSPDPPEIQIKQALHALMKIADITACT